MISFLLNGIPNVPGKMKRNDCAPHVVFVFKTTVHVTDRSDRVSSIKYMELHMRIRLITLNQMQDKMLLSIG